MICDWLLQLNCEKPGYLGKVTFTHGTLSIKIELVLLSPILSHFGLQNKGLSKFIVIKSLVI